ncbi:MAG TPA: STAS domain-containing protein [Ignavibacteriaceae bacterium]|nr:STAS domain-containing protein [Ignavibacteriaceae bacterium]
MSGEFNIQTETFDNTLVVKTEGYINNIAGEKISQIFSNSPNPGIRNAVFDLEKSKVINSIGISYLLEVIELLNERNGKIIFLNLDPSIEKTFKIMGLLQFAEVADSLDSALQVLN